MIKTAFIKKVASSYNTNSTFWHGRFRCVKNNAPFMDVDTLQDMKGIELLHQYYLNLANCHPDVDVKYKKNEKKITTK